MSDDWDRYAAGWDRDEDVRFYADQAFASLVAHVDVRGADWRHRRVLDFGCGTGLLAEKLAPLVKGVVAVDTSAEMIGELERKQLRNVQAIRADLDDPAIRSAASWFADFDLIVASSVCGFLPHYERTVATLCQALNANGIFVQWDWLASGDGSTGLSLDRVSAALDEAGLEDVLVREVFSMSSDEGRMPVLMATGTAG